MLSAPPFKLSVFHQSQHDPCLFIWKDCIILVYVDDCLFFGRSDAVFGYCCSYLSIDIRRTPEGHLELCQPGFINKIIAACGLQDQSFSHHTHSTMVLTADTSGLPCEHQWSYRSIIGMLNYLASFTWPDIAFAIHQCAHFTTAPRHVHELAIRQIV